MRNKAVTTRFIEIFIAGLNFFRLMFWTLPFKRETNQAKKVDIGFSYFIVLVFVLIEVLEPRPIFTAAGFPSMEQLTVVEGVLVEHPLERDSKYHTAPIGLRTTTGDVFKKCSSLGVRCIVEIDGNRGIGWRTYLGKPARMWFFDDLVVQLEIEGKIPFRFSYEESKRIYTGLGRYWLLLLILGYVMGRLIQWYAKPAFKEAFAGRSVTSNSAAA